jgi:hypothetical protein
MAPQHRFLGWVQAAICLGNILYRPQRHTINRMRQPDAAVNGLDLQLAIYRFTQYHRTCAAVALAAAFFRAGAAQVLTQQV